MNTTAEPHDIELDTSPAWLPPALFILTALAFFVFAAYSFLLLGRHFAFNAVTQSLLLMVLTALATAALCQRYLSPTLSHFPTGQPLLQFSNVGTTPGARPVWTLFTYGMLCLIIGLGIFPVASLFIEGRKLIAETGTLVDPSYEFLNSLNSLIFYMALLALGLNLFSSPKLIVTEHGLVYPFARDRNSWFCPWNRIVEYSWRSTPKEDVLSLRLFPTGPQKHPRRYTITFPTLPEDQKQQFDELLKQHVDTSEPALATTNP